jgi:hypothetical protein
LILAGSLLGLAACGPGGGCADAERPVAVPRLVGERLERAERRLEAVGLEARPRERFSKAPDGTVVAQRPRPGKRLRPGSAVSLWVSEGATPRPYGELRPTGVGPLEVGASPEGVLAAFGAPDRRSERNLGLGPAPEIDWRWRLRGGDELTLHFDASRRRLTGYCTDSPRLATVDGLRVGEVSIGMLGRRYSDQIAPARIGRNTYLLSSGQRGTYPALAFTFSEQSTLIGICGGEFPPAGD